MKAWNYQNSLGYQYPPESYTRHIYRNIWQQGNGLEKANNRIKLSAPWSGERISSGTWVSQDNSGGTHAYTWSGEIGPEWTKHETVLTKNIVRPGTVYLKPGWLLDYYNQGITTKFCSLSLKPLVANGLYEKDANIGIGIVSPSNKLEVSGTVRAEEVIVEARPWADFVFEDGYDLRTLDEVESHIAEHGHLPDVPSASSVQSEGLSVGETQKIMMQKIEELTLYMIEQNKMIRSQQERIEELKKGLEQVARTQ